jgi:hypothetical protein
MTTKTKRQLRRAVSLSPRAFLALRSLHEQRGEPMAAIVDRLIIAEAECYGIEVLSRVRARDEMSAIVDRRRLEDDRASVDAYARALESAREAFGG